MSTAQELYQSKLMTVEQALGQVEDKDLITVGLSPATFLSQLHTIHDRITEVTLYGGGGDHPYMEEPYRDKFFTHSNFYGAGARANHPHGRISLIPMHLHACYTRYYEVWQPNVIAVSASPMDRHGYFNLAINGWDLKFLPTARAVIIEVVEDMPRIHGDFFIHVSDVTAIVETDRKLHTFPETILNETAITIGNYVASLVEDGSTIQLGVGAIPDACAMALTDKQDIGVHSEMICNSMGKLAEMGVITNKRKTLNHGKMIGAFAEGTRELYDYLDDNLTVYMKHVDYVNDPWVIAQHDRMVSINSCIEVDLVGQIASETIGHRQYTGSGGQNDFAEGAIHSKGGKSIIAMAASGTNRAGERFSKIKPTLTPGAVVTMSRNNIDFIVTEYGIAPMKARTVKERIQNLVAIAHPDFRADLLKEAKELGL